MARVSLEESIEAFGHGHSTYPWEVIKALRHFGIPCDDKQRRVSRKRPVPPYALVGVVFDSGRTASGNKRTGRHWMVSWEGAILDPEERYPNVAGNPRITSFIELRPQEEKEEPC